MGGMPDWGRDFLGATVACCGLGAFCGVVAQALGIRVVATPADVFVLAVMALVALVIWWWTG